MQKRLAIMICAAVMVLTLVAGEALAVPMQRTVTVVNEQKQVVYRENIHYNNTYKQPAAKITVYNAPAENTVRQAQPLPSRAGGADARVLIKNATDLLGRPYAYGASGPSSFDCSGFTMYVFQKAGINLPHNAAAQYNVGVKVARSELVPGDLVFFGYYGSSGIQHVGIYIGDNTFIHSSTNNGVIKTSLSAPYYASNYKGAARVLR